MDVAALLRSPSGPVQLAALRASSSLSQHVETLPRTALPLIVKQLQSPDGEDVDRPCSARMHCSQAEK